MAHDSSPPQAGIERTPVDSVALTPGEVTALLRINQALSRHRERATLFAAIAQAIEGVVPADRCVVLLPESNGAAVTVYAVHGARKLFEGERIPDESVPAWVIRHRQRMSVASREEVCEHFPATHRRLIEEGMQSAVVLPLLVGDRCIGALSLMASAAHAFTQSSPQLLDEIANSVAVAIDGCLAYEQLQRQDRERKALLEVTTAVGRHLERDDLFGAMAVCLRDLVPTERFGIELPIDGGRLQGHLLTPRGRDTEPTRPTVLPAAGTACDWVLQRRQWLVFATRDELRERFPVTFDVMREEGMESLCALPLISGERCPGVLFFMAARQGAYDTVRRDFLDHVAAAVAAALDDCLAHEEVRRLRDRLAAENVYLQQEILQEHNFGEIVGRSPALREMLSRVDLVAPTNTTVLIVGETGTGKELIARAIHERSTRRDRPLVKLNCSAISAGLVESELFGHVKGAFTGAQANRTGRFGLADGGTIFLDEIGELPLDTQAKLLRVLQEQEFEPVGSSQPRRVDVRVIGATNRDLEQAVAERRFRSDLFFRVNVFPIRVPALRERRGDIPLLVHFFVERLAREMGKHVDAVSSGAMARLASYDWPGNVRELQNIIERAMVLARGPTLELSPDSLLDAIPTGGSRLGGSPASRTQEPPSSVPEQPAAGGSANLDEVRKQHLLRALERCDWVIEGPGGAARLLGLQPSTLRGRLKKLGLHQRPSRATQ
jgi:formate hydrogenlyase transcriptional activator